MVQPLVLVAVVVRAVLVLHVQQVQLAVSVFRVISMRPAR
jgi:hypothetical protein